MPIYEVRVEGTAVELYLVKADTQEQALKNWSNGELISDYGEDFGPVSAVLDFDQEDEDAEEDEYEDDPLQHGIYDD